METCIKVCNEGIATSFKVHIANTGMYVYWYIIHITLHMHGFLRSLGRAGQPRWQLDTEQRFHV